MAFSYSSRNWTPIINTLSIDQVFSKLLSHLTFIIHSHKVIIKKSLMFSVCFNFLIFQPLKDITQCQLLEGICCKNSGGSKGWGGNINCLNVRAQRQSFYARGHGSIIEETA